MALHTALAAQLRQRECGYKAPAEALLSAAPWFNGPSPYWLQACVRRSCARAVQHFTVSATCREVLVAKALAVGSTWVGSTFPRICIAPMTLPEVMAPDLPIGILIVGMQKWLMAPMPVSISLLVYSTPRTQSNLRLGSASSHLSPGSAAVAEAGCAFPTGPPLLWLHVRRLVPLDFGTIVLTPERGAAPRLT